MLPSLYSDVPTGAVTDKAPVIEYDGYPYLTADQLRGPGWMTSVQICHNHHITVLEEEDGSLTYYDEDKSTGTVMYPSETSKYNADGSLKKASLPLPLQRSKALYNHTAHDGSTNCPGDR